MADEMRSLSEAETDAVCGGALVITMKDMIVSSVVAEPSGTVPHRAGDDPVR